MRAFWVVFGSLYIILIDISLFVVYEIHIVYPGLTCIVDNIWNPRNNKLTSIKFSRNRGFFWKFGLALLVLF